MITSLTADYASVNEQSGIIAGDGGYTVEVANHTNLTGGIITSTVNAEDNGLNSFTTATLTASDIQNHASASSESTGYSLSTSDLSGSKYAAAKAIARNYMDNADESETHTSTTYSGINTANITITDEKAQIALTGKTSKQTIEQINKDIADLANSLGEIDYQARDKGVG